MYCGMKKNTLKSVAHMLVVLGFTFYLLSGFLEWQVLCINSYYGSEESQGVAPAGVWIKYSDNYSKVSAIIPFPTDTFSNRSDNTSLLSHMSNRASIFNMIWYMYLINAVIFFAMGLLYAFNVEKFYFIGALSTGALILISIIFFFLFYPLAFAEDVGGMGVVPIGPFGDEVITTGSHVFSCLSVGFLFAVLSSIILLISGGVYYSALTLAPAEGRGDKKKEKVAEKREGRGEQTVAAKSKKNKKEEMGDIRTLKIECPNCGKVFEVQVDMGKLPVTVQCPYCGTEGEIG